MRNKQTIAIYGTNEKIGSGIAHKLAAGNYRLLLVAKNKDDVKGLEKEITHVLPHSDIEAITCGYDACWEADVIILAGKQAHDKTLAENIREVANQKLVISIIEKDNTVDDDHKSFDELQKLLPNSKIISATVHNDDFFFSEYMFSDAASGTFSFNLDIDSLSMITDIAETAGLQIRITDSSIK